MAESLEECAARIVRQEIRSDVSQLVLMLATSAGSLSILRGQDPQGLRHMAGLSDQAIELCAHVDNWEEAARQAGWRPKSASFDGVIRWVNEDRESGDTDFDGTAEALCEREGLDPYQWEVYEHWAVSLPLGEKLAARGEKVDFDFAGLVVWARTNTGQAIETDSVIEAIAADIVAANKEQRT